MTFFTTCFYGADGILRRDFFYCFIELYSMKIKAHKHLLETDINRHQLIPRRLKIPNKSDDVIAHRPPKIFALRLFPEKKKYLFSFPKTNTNVNVLSA